MLTLVILGGGGRLVGCIVYGGVLVRYGVKNCGVFLRLSRCVNGVRDI